MGDWRYLLALFFLLLTERGGWAQTEDSDYADEDYDELPAMQPEIHTDPQNLTVRPGDTVRLPCHVVHLDPVYVLMWKKGSNTILWAGNVRLSKDERLKKYDNNTLDIKNVRPDDAAEYHCQISNRDMLEVVHTVHVLVPPKVHLVPPGTTKVVKKGEPFTLQCNATGYPPPKVMWNRKGKSLPSGRDFQEGTSITFDSATRHHSGVYQCTASNDVDKPASAHVNLQVQYSPEIEVERESVNSAEGYESELTCTVHAEPKANVVWFKNSKLLESSSHYVLSKEPGNKHVLQIKETMESDFGNYTCFANNSIGRSSGVIELSGVPSLAMFKMNGMGGNGQNPQLQWVVESYSPITEYKLMYRKAESDGEWQTVSPVVVNPEGNIYTVSHTLSDLTPGDYEAVLLSKNTYGWSRQSAYSKFSTDFQNTEPVPDSGVAEPSSGDSNSSEVFRPRLVPWMTIISLCAFFL